jgi:ParB-like chromosome segregation protein Spo0J
MRDTQKRLKSVTDREAQAWPGDQVERRAVSQLVPYAQNARTHTPDQVDLVARSIREFGFTMPVLVDEANGIIAGHARVMAARLLGLPEVPVIIARNWPEDRKRAYVLADNKIALGSGWDDELLRQELEALRKVDFDIGLTGFSDKDLDKLFAIADEPDTTAQLTGLSYAVVIRCRDEAHQTELLARFEKEKLECDALIS